jgi:hypothetical protein
MSQQRHIAVNKLRIEAPGLGAFAGVRGTV